MICQGCGGLLGRDCFNQYDCMRITESMNNQDLIQPYIDALNDCRNTINWMIDNMSVDDNNLQSDACNIPTNTLCLIDVLAPKPRTTEDLQRDLDELPF